MDDRNAWLRFYTPSRNLERSFGNDWLLAAALIELFSGQGFSSLLGHTVVLKPVNVRLRANINN